MSRHLLRVATVMGITALAFSHGRFGLKAQTHPRPSLRKPRDRRSRG